MFFLIVINPASGKSGYLPKKNALVNHFKDHKIPYEIYHTQSHDGIQHLSNYLKTNTTITDIAVLGGDGTINLCINAIPHFNYTISIISNGTGNDAVKNFSSKKTFAQQIDTIINGKVIEIDLGKCNGRYFINGVGIGFDGLVVEKMVARKNKKRGLWAYLSMVLTLLPKKIFFPVKISPTNGEITKNIFSMNVTKGTTFGGGFLVNPKANPSDGKLDICRFEKLNLLEKAIILPCVLIGKHGWFKKVSYSKTDKLEIYSNQPIPAHIDGEIMKSDQFIFEVIPSGLKVRI